MTCHGHAHTYEFAWSETGGAPFITDLRVTSEVNTAVTSDSLKRINTEVLARAAKRYDTEDANKNARQLNESLRTAMAAQRAVSSPQEIAVSAAEWLETLDDPDMNELARQLRAEGPEAAAKRLDAVMSGPGLTLRTTEANIRSMALEAGVIKEAKRGREPLDREFLSRVAEWAREGKDRNVRNIYEFVAEQASRPKELGGRGYKVSTDMVKKWLRRCRSEQLLGPDELRQPRTPRKL